MILVDTSVWIEHLRTGDDEMVELLEEEFIVTHPFVIGELACGNLKNRSEVLSLLEALSKAPVASDREVLLFIETRGLMARGIGYIDAHLLASTALAPDTHLWTRDRRLAQLADEMGLAWGRRRS